MTKRNPEDLELAKLAFSLLQKKYSLAPLTQKFTCNSAQLTLSLTRPHPPLTLSFLTWAHETLPHILYPTVSTLALQKNYPFALHISSHLLSLFSPKSIFASLFDSFSLLSVPFCSKPFDVLVKSCCLRSGGSQVVSTALAIFELSRNGGIDLSVVSYNSILDAMFRYKFPVNQINQFYMDMTKNGVCPNIYTYNILIKGFCSVGEVKRGAEIFDEMVGVGCLPNVVSYNTMINGYCRSRMTDEAFKTLRNMWNKGVRPNLITYNTIVNGLCKEGRVMELESVMSEMTQNGLTPNEITYNTLVNGYCMRGDVHKALVLHEEMASNGVAPNVVSYTSLINAMCKHGNLSRAMEFVRQMKDRGLRLNEMTYTSLIDGFSRKGFLDDALGLMEEMKANGIFPSVISYNALINGYCKLGRMDMALGIVREVEKLNLAPDVVTYSTIINAYCKIGDLENAFRLSEEMVEKGMPLDVITYSSLIRGLCDARRLDDAFTQFNTMLKHGLSPDEFTYTTLINGHCKEGDVEKAFHLHDEMVKKGILPDVVTYSVLINGLSKVARTKEARRLLFRLYYDGSIPDKVTYDALMSCCEKVEPTSVVSLIKSLCMKGMVQEADRVFESVFGKNCKPDEASYSIIIHGHCRGGNVRKALKCYEEMMELGFVPSAISIISLIKGLYLEGMSDELDDVISKLMRSCLLTDCEASKFRVEVNYKNGNMEALLDVLSSMAKDGLLPNSRRIISDALNSQLTNTCLNWNCQVLHTGTWLWMYLPEKTISNDASHLLFLYSSTIFAFSGGGTRNICSFGTWMMYVSLLNSTMEELQSLSCLAGSVVSIEGVWLEMVVLEESRGRGGKGGTPSSIGRWRGEID